MTRQDCIDALMEYFELDNCDLNSYDWQSGCSMGSCDKPWLTLANVVEALEYFFEEEE